MNSIGADVGCRRMDRNMRRPQWLAEHRTTPTSVWVIVCRTPFARATQRPLNPEPDRPHFPEFVVKTALSSPVLSYTAFPVFFVGRRK